MDEGVIREGVVELRETFRDGRTRGVVWRKRQLQALVDLLHDNQQNIFQALVEDLGKHPVESYRDELGIVKKSAIQSLRCLDKWMAPKKASLPWIFMPASGELVSEPLGVVLILSSWNFPISLSLDPLIGAIAAGNTALLKPSELAPACSSLLAHTIPQYLDSKAVKVIQGGHEVSQLLLRHKWDKIFYTGSSRVARIVMGAAAEHLTPVTLELGGKCPAIFDCLSTLSEYKVAVQRIVGGKWGLCGGQACIGIDYVLVEHQLASTLIESLKTSLATVFGENKRDLCRVVNKPHFERLRSLITHPDVAATIVHGGSTDEQNLLIEPTILLNPPLDADIMTQEVFGPLLPLITVNNIEESIGFINSKPKPLAIYAFTKDEAFKDRIVRETSSGSLTFNDCVIQFICDSFPFGGVGESGLGRYHGKYSFETFSHEKAVLRRCFWFDIDARYPPWNDYKLKFINLAYKFDYFGLAALVTGLNKYH